MESSLFNRLQASLLAVVTAGLFALAVLNLLEERKFQQPDDGVWWREAAGGLEAERVLPNSPGQREGIKAHDLLTGAQVLPDSSGAPGPRTGIETQDLLSGTKTLPENPGRNE